MELATGAYTTLGACFRTSPDTERKILLKNKVMQFILEKDKKNLLKPALSIQKFGFPWPYPCSIFKRLIPIYNHMLRK